MFRENSCAIWRIIGFFFSKKTNFFLQFFNKKYLFYSVSVLMSFYSFCVWEGQIDPPLSGYEHHNYSNHTHATKVDKLLAAGCQPNSHVIECIVCVCASCVWVHRACECILCVSASCVWCMMCVSAWSVWVHHVCECIMCVSASCVWARHVCECVKCVSASHVWVQRNLLRITHDTDLLGSHMILSCSPLKLHL